MFVEEAWWLRRKLPRLSLPPDPRVLNVASSTEHFRTVEQPHNDSEVLAPLRARGAKITHLDIKDDPGVDVVLDLTEPELDLRAHLGAFDLVLATGLIEHFDATQVSRLCGQLLSVTERGGFLALTTPLSYRRTMDPVDPGYRPSPDDLIAELRTHGRIDVVESEVLRIDNRRYYKSLLSRASVVPIRGRWVSLPGASEQVRRRVKRWRWRETCLIVRRLGQSGDDTLSRIGLSGGGSDG